MALQPLLLLLLLAVASTYVLEYASSPGGLWPGVSGPSPVGRGGGGASSHSVLQIIEPVSVQAVFLQVVLVEAYAAASRSGKHEKNIMPATIKTSPAKSRGKKNQRFLSSGP